MKYITHYLIVWKKLTLNSFEIALASRFGAIMFTVGKIFRFISFLLILILLVTKTNTLAGYTLIQTLVFFLTFNVIDTFTQLLFRDVYRFRQLIVSGDFDLVLIKPMSPLFKVLLGGADPLDVFMLIPYLGLLAFFVFQIRFAPIAFINYLLLILNAFLIAAAFHILVLALGVLTTEIDHAIMIYRDVTGMARFPIDIYQEPLRGLITFLIPIGIMMSFPPKALFGDLSISLMMVAFVIGIGFLFLSFRLWKFALKHYTSASS